MLNKVEHDALVYITEITLLFSVQCDDNLQCYDGKFGMVGSSSLDCLLMV